MLPSKQRRKVDNNKLTDNKDVDSNVSLGTLLQSRKNLPKLVQTKKKTPAILMQDTAKSPSNPFQSTRSVASLSAKKQTKGNDSNVPNENNSEDYDTSLDKMDVASTLNNSSAKAKSTQTYVLPCYFAHKYLTCNSVEKLGRPSGERMCLLCHKTFSAKTLSTTPIRHLKLLHNLTEALASNITEGKTDTSLDLKPAKHQLPLSAIKITRALEERYNSGLVIYFAEGGCHTPTWNQ